jgi:transcriptional regulator with GAF, ATPase, and Fis domain
VANAASPTLYEVVPDPPAPAVSTVAAAGIGTLDQAMREHIQRALIATRGTIEGRRGAAKLLGINPHTLRARMRKLGLNWSRFRHE